MTGMRGFSDVVALLAASIAISFAAPILRREGQILKSACIVSPVIDSDFADPSMLELNGRYYAYATNRGARHVQFADSDDFVHWTLHKDIDVLDNLPDWVSPTNPNVWAPKVWQRKDGLFVPYYSATHRVLTGYPDQSQEKHCIGAAIATVPQGPFVPTPGDALICSMSQGGIIDPSHFRDPEDGQDYIMYKIDGNSVGHGGMCGNTASPIVPTPIMLRKVSDDGLALIGEPMQILDRDDNDGPLVEAPSMARRADGLYMLTFSSNCWNNPGYNIKFALSNKVEGPYHKFGPILSTGILGLQSPGGADLSSNGTMMVFHGGHGRNRAMYSVSMELFFTSENGIVSATSLLVGEGASVSS